MSYTLLGKNTGNAMRLAEVMHVFVKHGFADMLRRIDFHNRLPARVLQGLNLMNAPSGEHATFGQRLCAAFTELGPTFIKFGQVLSTRPDLLRPEVAQELSLLQNQVAPLPYALMAPVITRSLDVPFDEVFMAFDQTPVASASLSQVYKAVLVSGETVAVKVQRPGIEKVIDSDVRLIRQLAEWAEGRLDEKQWMDPVGVVDEFARSIQRELDFTIEARIIESFRENFAEEPRVFIPRVYTRHSSRHMLVMDWVDGIPVDRLEAYPARNSDPSAVAVLGCEMLCRMVFDHRLFHADPHPGNILLMDNNRLAFIDMGMAGHLERGDAGAMADVLYTMFRQDAPACAESVLKLTARGVPADRERFEHEVAEFIAFEAQVIISGGQVAKGLERATQILRQFNLELAPRFALLLKALSTIELVGRSLDPTLDMVPLIRPHIERVIHQRFEPGEMLREARTNAAAFVKLGREFPGEISYLLQQLRRGKVKFEIHHEHLENLAATIDRSSSRNTVGIIVAALIVGSSLLITTETTVSHLGLAGFIIAGLLGLMLVISILWSHKF